MAKFVRSQLDMFLGAVRKYMQVRGNLSQKDLAELTDSGVSTISRLINRKIKDIDAQLIAKIVVELEIPLHEIIDFIAEDSEERFKKMLKFYKDLKDAEERGEQVASSSPEDDAGEIADEDAGAIGDALGGGTAKENINARIKVGGKQRTIPFSTEDKNKKDISIRDKLESLSPRQKAYLTDFLNLDVEGRDLLVDLGNSLFRYIRQKGFEFDF